MSGWEVNSSRREAICWRNRNCLVFKIGVSKNCQKRETLRFREDHYEIEIDALLADKPLRSLCGAFAAAMRQTVTSEKGFEIFSCQIELNWNLKI
jgi:hypothetical protein